MNDVGARQLMAVMETHAFAKRRDVLDRRGLIQALSEPRDDAHVLVQVHQVVENQLGRLVGIVVGGNPRIEVVRAGRHADDDHVRPGV